MNDFWQKLPKPFFVLAPMANVTDSVFRKMIAKYGRPDVTWTEFVSADGLCSPDGRKKLSHDLEFSPKERPIVAQLFTGHPEVMRQAAELVAKLGFDGLDINMGCPDRAVEKQGGGAAAMKDPKGAIEVLQAAREGVFAAAGGEHSRDLRSNEARMLSPRGRGAIPVSIKTRVGYNKVDLDWIKLLLEQRLPALTIHLRTRKEMSDGSAHWEMMPEIIKMRDQIQAGIPIKERTLIIGNGDVESLADGAAKCKKYGCDGIMIGRGIFGKPWLFERSKKKGVSLPAGQAGSKEKTPEERLKIMLEHAKLFEKTFCGRKKIKNFAVMKKHFKAYVSGWNGAKELRVRLMEAGNFKEVTKIVNGYLLAAR